MVICFSSALLALFKRIFEYIDNLLYKICSESYMLLHYKNTGISIISRHISVLSIFKLIMITHVYQLYISYATSILFQNKMRFLLRLSFENYFLVLLSRGHNQLRINLT